MTSNTLYAPFIKPQIVERSPKPALNGAYCDGFNRMNDRAFMAQHHRSSNNYYKQPNPHYVPDRIPLYTSAIQYCSPDELYQLECSRRIEAESLALRRRQLEYMNLYRRSSNAPYQNPVLAPQSTHFSNIYNVSSENNPHSALKQSWDPCHYNGYSFRIVTDVQDPLLKAGDYSATDEHINVDDVSSSPTSGTSNRPSFQCDSISPPDTTCMPPLTRIVDFPQTVQSENISSSTEETKPKKKPAKIRCSICGEDAICKSYGAVCCDSCRLFFRRTIVKKAHTAFKCSSKR